MTRISVIIPAYADAVRLRRTLRRLRDIRASEYPDLEIIVAVRPSADDTMEVARSLADEVVLTEGFVSEARNDGAEAASGEVLLFLDADSVPSFGTLPKIAVAAQQDIIGTCSSFSHSSGWGAYVATSCQNALRALHLIKGASMLFCHRSIFFEKGIRYDASRNIGEHQDFVLRAEKRGARYRYLRIARGYEVDVARYERFGYARILSFWTLFTLCSLLFGSFATREFEQLYWSKKGCITYRELCAASFKTLRQYALRATALFGLCVAIVVALSASLQ